MDTDSATRSRYQALVRNMPKPLRLERAIALSALVRSLAWEGATRNAGHLGADAVVRRFLRQLYGPDVARRFCVSNGRTSSGE